MKFTEYLINEALPADPVQPQTTHNRMPQPEEHKPRGRMAGNKFVPNAGEKAPQDPWEKILKASTDPNSGREFITLLGSMYQAKRRNPSVQMTPPKLITTLPDKTPEQQALKQNMAQLFKIAQNDDA